MADYNWSPGGTYADDADTLGVTADKPCLAYIERGCYVKGTPYADGEIVVVSIDDYNFLCGANFARQPTIAEAHEAAGG